jgi:hypothetical protein
MKQKFTELNYQGTYSNLTLTVTAILGLSEIIFFELFLFKQKNHIYINHNLKKFFLILCSFIGMIVKLKFHCFSCCKIAIYYND